MFIRNENFKQYINAYPVVSILIAINLVVYIIRLIRLPLIRKQQHYLIPAQLIMDLQRNQLLLLMD